MKLTIAAIVITATLLCSRNQDKFVHEQGSQTIAQVMAENQANGSYRGFPGVK
jgi:hypothetical protein